MKTIRWSQIIGGLCAAGLLAIVQYSHAQTTTDTGSGVMTDPNEDVSNLSDLEVELKALETATPVAASNEPSVGNFYSAQHAPGSADEWPPLPGNIFNLPVWPLDTNIFVLDDLDFNYGGVSVQDSARTSAMASGTVTMGAGADDLLAPMNAAPDYGTNLWIAQVGMASGYLTGIASNTIADVPYELVTCQSLDSAAQWVSTGIFIYGSETTNWTTLNPLQISLTNNLFIRLRSWIDSDNVGIPDWWQLEYFGYVGINPYADSPSGDGFTFWQKYQNGLNPTNFETPPSPNNFVAVLSTNGTDVLLSWNAAQGSVTNYSLVGYGYDSGTEEYYVLTNATVGGSTTNFDDVGAIQNGNYQYGYYALTANYQGNNVSGTAYSSIYAVAPAPPTPPVVPYNINVSATLVRNGTGRWQVMFSGLPANASTINLIWSNGTTQNISTNAIVNGIYQIPDAAVVNVVGATLSVQGIGANGETGQINQAGVLPSDAPYFVDGRQDNKQNLEFLIRGASMTEPFFGKYGYYYQVFNFDGNELFEDPVEENFNENSTNLEEFSFLHHGQQLSYEPYGAKLDDLWPFTANYDLANYFVNTSRTNPLPFGTNNFSLAINFATNVPAPSLLTHSDPYWILQGGLDTEYPSDSTNWGITVSGDITQATLTTGINNLFGLAFQTGCEVDMQFGPAPYGFAVNCSYQTFDLGSTVTAATNYFIGDYASWCPEPTLQFTNYYFAPLVNPDNNPTNLPDVSQQPIPLPIDDTFNITNQTPPLIIGAVGQPMILGGWAKYAVQGSANKYAYLGQYFETNAFLLNGSGNITTNSAGILSPYGEFFPTQAGRAALVTMPDIDPPYEQGTGIVQIVSLNVDANHDGTMDLSYFGQDQTSPSKPYVFWSNNNFDRGHSVDFSDFEQDDLQSDDCPYTPGTPTPDCNYQDINGNRVIPCTRDLEDFSRLWISGVTSNVLDALPSGSTISLSWGDVGNPNSGNPTIDIFQASDGDGGLEYLTNETAAAAQIDPTPNLYLGRIAPGQSLQLNPEVLGNYGGNHFIWCGVTNGTGKLTLTFANANGVVLGQASVYIQIVDIKQMYERWTVGDNPNVAPASTASIAQDDLDSSIAPFQYGPATTNTPYILLAHGWNMPVWAKDRYAETAFKRLYWHGYQGRFGLFRWPTLFSFPFEAFQFQSVDFDNFDTSEFNSWNSAAGLLNLLSSLNAEYPGKVYLMAHSMGNVVSGEALRLTGTSRVVNTYVAMQAAIASQTYDASAPTRSLGIFDSDTPNRYAQYYTNGAPCYFNASVGAGSYVNFFNTNDYALNKWLTDQNLKPDAGYEWVYQGTNTTEYYTYTSPLLQVRDLYYPTNTYEIFSYGDEARCYALGAQANVGGAFKVGATDQQIELDIAPYNFGSTHKYHSAEFRSDSAQRWQFWNQVLVEMKLQ